MDSNKQAYLSPAAGMLDISVIRDARPYAVISLDLGIPNFTVFSLKFPLVEDKSTAMSELVAEAVHTLLDEMSAFMLSLNFEQNVIVGIYAAVLTCFKGMTGEADTNKSLSPISKDPTVKTFEGTFKLPMEFVNETYSKVVTASAPFDAWFKGSKVVNPDGTPKKVYHGTGADISEFSYEFVGKGNDQLGSGFYFTDHADTASGYATSRSQTDTPKPGGEQGNVMPVFLRLIKPIHLLNGEAEESPMTTAQIRRIMMASPILDDVLTDFGDVEFEGKAKVINSAVEGYKDYDLKRQMFLLHNDFFRDNNKEFFEAMHKTTGYDGIIAPAGDNPWASSNQTHYVAWFPNQIKSAIGNSGQYSLAENSVTAAGKQIKRPPVHRHLELTYEKPSKTTVQDARTVIKQFRNRSLKSQPSPMYVIVYDSMGKARGTIPIGPNFKNQLLNQVYKKGSEDEKVEFSPTIKFDNDIEMKTTNAEGIPKSIFVGNEQYTPVATISDDMALYSSNEKDEFVVKFTDGRCVAFADFPTVESLKDENYPVPTVYTNWSMLSKDEVPESSDENEAVDERGTEVIEGTETETDPVADLKPDDEKNEQLEEGIDENPDGVEKTSGVHDYRIGDKRPHGMSSQSWQAIQRQLKEEEKKFDPDAYIDPLSNVWGKLPSDVRKKLIRVLKNPNNKTWSDACSLIINGKTMMTLWQAVLKVDPWFPRSGPDITDKNEERQWEKIPTRRTLVEAMRLANPAKQDISTTDYDRELMKSLGIQASKKAQYIDDNGYWAGAGGGASGILPICTSTGRICLGWRSNWVQEGDCWGTIGGAIQKGMSPADSAKEELKEETGYAGSVRLIPSFVFTHGTFKYYNFLGLVPSEFDLHPMQGGSSNLQFSDETDAIAWFTWDDLQNDVQENAGDYHSGVLKLLQQSGDQIRQICEAASNKSTGG
jgi:8-oxo-dGTP pyrophosphatase MutT (NUDIX family)